MAKRNVMIVWDEEMDTLVQQFVDAYAGEMTREGYLPYTNAKGGLDVNRSGALKTALKMAVKARKPTDA